MLLQPFHILLVSRGRKKRATMPHPFSGYLPAPAPRTPECGCPLLSSKFFVAYRDRSIDVPGPGKDMRAHSSVGVIGRIIGIRHVRDCSAIFAEGEIRGVRATNIRMIRSLRRWKTHFQIRIYWRYLPVGLEIEGFLWKYDQLARGPLVAQSLPRLYVPLSVKKLCGLYC